MIVIGNIYTKWVRWKDRGILDDIKMLVNSWTSCRIIYFRSCLVKKYRVKSGHFDGLAAGSFLNQAVSQELKTEKEQAAMPKPKIKARNRFACDPIMRKGGAHVKAKCTSRRKSSHLIDGGIDEWQEEFNYDQNASASDRGGSGADDCCILFQPVCIVVLPFASL